MFQEADSAFRFQPAEQSTCELELLAQPPGTRTDPITLWSRRFDTGEDRDAVLDAVSERQLDPIFLGRLTMMFGAAALDEMADTMIAEAQARRIREVDKELKRARDHLVVQLYARKDKHGRHTLELERKNSRTAEWSVRYDRALERDRLCDWLRWQKGRFLDFLDHAAEHGDEVLARMLVDEMFVTERRVKKEGRGAGGSRPLRMWRGD